MLIYLYINLLIYLFIAYRYWQLSVEGTNPILSIVFQTNNPTTGFESVEKLMALSDAPHSLNIAIRTK